MARVFISYSSEDSDFASRLHGDLDKFGHTPWLDELEIQVGDSISAKIDEGIADADFLVVVLSPRAMESGWVDREWRAKYGEEVRSGRKMVLTALLEECKLPPLLADKRYARFHQSYEIGLADLVVALSPDSNPTRSGPALDLPSRDDGIGTLLTKVSRKQVTLNECLTDGVQLGRRLGERDLESFCRKEIEGYPTSHSEDAERPSYRLFPTYASFTEINPTYLGWGGQAAPMFAHMRSHPDDFVPQQLFVGESVAALEAKPFDDSGISYGTIQTTHGAGHPDSKAPNTPIFLFYEARVYRDVVEAIRAELTRKILALLPEGPSV